MNCCYSKRVFAALVAFGVGSTEVVGDPLTYEVVGDTVTIKDCKASATGELVIPLTYDGKTVTRIGEDAFNGCSSLTSVTIPDSVTSIGYQAFADCSSLTSIIFEGNAPDIYNSDSVFKGVSENAKIFVHAGATGFGETFSGLPVIILKEIKINAFSKSASPFTIGFETKSDSTYIIEATHNLKQWGKIGEVQGTGSSVKFTDPRLPIVPFERNYFRVKLVE